MAGNDTSRHTTSHALTLHPEQRAWLLDDRDGRLPGAVEEFVRWATPVLTFRRTTTREVQLHGQRLPAEEMRDFDVGRDPNRHLDFGGGGPRYCLGASLAKTQLRAIFSEMLRVMPDIEAGEPELLRSAFIHGVKRMPCMFTARA